ncbi:MAG: CPBP family intramembrane glutamic endopeptidase [Woeseiaceae bacterium]
MKSHIWPALGGLAVAIAITTTMDATGYAMFSALPLLPLVGLFWYLQKFSRTEIGLVWGRARFYGLAIVYPFLVLGAVAAIAYAFHAVDTSNTDWTKALLNMGLMSSVGTLIVLLTEEGFFRGWLWASLTKAGYGDTSVLIGSTLAFTAWHISAISLDTGFDIPADEIPIYLINATLIGGIFGIFRMISGSAVVPSLCHAVWNGINYPLFGFGEKPGALGIEETHLYGPEVGLLGIGLNLAFFAFLWRKYVPDVHEISSNIH